MKSYEVVGYAYEAALHCLECTAKRFPATAETEPETTPIDREGNEISPVFAGDEPGDCGDYCEDCHEALDNMPDDWDAELLEQFLNENSADILADLNAVCINLKATIESDPAAYTEHGTEEPSIDVRLCIDINHSRAGATWAIRTGSSDYDQRHSEYCAALSVKMATDAAELLTDLISQLGD